MRRHIYACFFFCCDAVFLQGKHNGCRHIAESAQSESFERVPEADFDYTSKSVKNLLPIQKFALVTGYLRHCDENRWVYFARIGRHSEKSWRKRDDACRA